MLNSNMSLNDSIKSFIYDWPLSRPNKNKKTTNINKEGLYENVMELFKGYHYGLAGTEKRKAYPINRYNSFYGFKED